jgi:uncharacterized protein DUF222
VFDLLPPLLDETKEIVASLQPALMTGVQAAAMVRDFAELERVASAGRLLLAHRVEETHAWEGTGHRSAAEWMAAQTGGSLGNAKEAFETSRNLFDQPTLDEAIRTGALSAEKAAAVSDAAKKKPETEDELVGKAKNSPLSKTRDECNRAKARGEDAEERAKRCHANRKAFLSRERDGMVTLNATGPVAEMAKLRAAFDKRTDQIFRARNRAKTGYEPRDRYAFDALIELITGDGERAKNKTRVNAQIRIDITALWRGWVVDGEICDAPGVGALTVQEVERLLMAEDTLIDAVIVRGKDVIRTARIDRYIPADQRRALQMRDPCCCITDCTWNGPLENDHTDGYANTRLTSIERLRRYCPPHHWLKTHRGYEIHDHPDGTTTIDPPSRE